MARPNRLSPGIAVFEKDSTLRVSSDLTFAGAIAGNFIWGPADEVRLLSTEEALIATYGLPTDASFKDWFVTSEFLAEAGALNVARIVPSDAYNAIAGGAGIGMTLVTTVVSGELSSATINAAGTGYAPGDIVFVDGGVVDAQVRVLTVDTGGIVLTIEVIVNGTGYAGSAAAATTSVNAQFQSKNDEEFLNSTVVWPEIIARYPGVKGNDYGIGIVRASEFFGWQYEALFRKAPAADMSAFTGDGLTTTFSITDAFVAASDQVVTIGGIPVVAGVAVGNYGLVGNVMTFIADTETYTGDEQTDSFTLVNAADLDMSRAVLQVGGSVWTRSTAAYGHIPYGEYRINTTTAKVELGTDQISFSGNGVTDTWGITTAKSVDETNSKVFLDGVAKTIVVIAPADDTEVQISTVAGGYEFTFHATGIPATGNGNIIIQWGFIDAVTPILLTMGLPNGTNDLRTFGNQTGVHALVWDRDSSDILEKYSDLSTVSTSKYENGLSNYYVNAISDASTIIRITKELTAFGDFLLNLGTDGSVLTTSEYQATYDLLYSDKDTVQVRYLIDPVVDSKLSLKLMEIAEGRTDAVAFIGGPSSLTLNNRGQELTDVKAYYDNFRSSDYATNNVFWIKVYDRFNAVDRWIPETGTIAGLYAKTHKENNFWTSAAGYNRGALRRALALSWNTTEAERDELYVNNINFTVRNRGTGYNLLGQKTMLRKESAFNRLNVRFLAIYAKRAPAEFLKFVLFETNNEITRAGVRNGLNPFFRDIQARGGAYAFEVKCDSENNPANIIDANELIVDIYLQPSRTIEFIGLSLIFTATGVSFSENTAT